eukprot:112702-Pleurochrysis_carterae.AAC.1
MLSSADPTQLLHLGSRGPLLKLRERYRPRNAKERRQRLAALGPIRPHRRLRLNGQPGASTHVARRPDRTHCVLPALCPLAALRAPGLHR